MSTMIERTPPLMRGPTVHVRAHATLDRLLLACGVIYALVYAVANDVVAAGLYDGYSRMSRAVSELSARGAPSTWFLTAMLPLHMSLLGGFGIGVWRSAGAHRALRVAGAVVVVHAATAALWLLAPMSRRENIAAGAGGVNDTMHIVLTAVTGLLIVGYVGFAAAALGWRFRLYSILTVSTMLAAGAWTGAESANLSSGGPTPWLGFAERISMVAWLVWLVVLAVALLRRGPSAPR